MQSAVDKDDTVNFTVEEILMLADWVLLNFILNQRTGLKYFKDFAVPRDALLIDMIFFC